MRSFKLLTLCIVFVSWRPTFGQSVSKNTVSSDNPGIAQVHQSISAMGGEKWSGVGASTAQSTLLYSNGKTTVMTTSDDWSGGRNRHRRDLSLTDSKNSTLTTEQRTAFVNNSKILKTVQADYDLVALTVAYPAVSLRMALSRRCQFRSLTPTNTLIAEQFGAVSMDCYAANYPSATAHFIWWFGSSGLPSQIQVPLLSVDGRLAVSRTLRIKSYREINGLTVPAEIETLINGQLSTTETVTDVQFQASLPSATFVPPSAK